MQTLAEVKALIASGKKREAWDLLSQLLKDNPYLEEGWQIAISLASPASKKRIAERALSYLPKSNLFRDYEHPPHAEELVEDNAAILSTRESEASNPSRKFLRVFLILGVVLLTAAICKGFVNSRVTSSSVNSTPYPTSTDVPKSAYLHVPIEDVDKDPEKYSFEYLTFDGEVFNISESNGEGFLQMWVEGNASGKRYALYVSYRGDLSNVFEGSDVTVWGFSLGGYEGENAYGGTIYQPWIHLHYITVHTH